MHVTFQHDRVLPPAASPSPAPAPALVRLRMSANPLHKQCAVTCAVVGVDCPAPERETVAAMVILFACLATTHSASPTSQQQRSRRSGHYSMGGEPSTHAHTFAWPDSSTPVLVHCCNFVMRWDRDGGSGEGQLWSRHPKIAWRVSASTAAPTSTQNHAPRLNHGWKVSPPCHAQAGS